MRIKNILLLIIVPSVLLSGIIMLFYGVDNNINSMNLEYISSCGYTAEEKCADISYFRIPEEFDSVFSAYNDIVKQGGFDLSLHRGERAVRYSYIITDHPDSDRSRRVRANIIICNNEISAADITLLSSDGFTKALALPK